MAEDNTQDVSIAVLQEKLKNLEMLAVASLKKIEALEEDRAKALKWGIMLLGTAVLSMATYIFNNLMGRVPHL